MKFAQLSACGNCLYLRAAELFVGPKACGAVEKRRSQRIGPFKHATSVAPLGGRRAARSGQDRRFSSISVALPPSWAWPGLSLSATVLPLASTTARIWPSTRRPERALCAAIAARATKRATASDTSTAPIIVTAAEIMPTQHERVACFSSFRNRSNFHCETNLTEELLETTNPSVIATRSTISSFSQTFRGWRMVKVKAQLVN